MTEKELKILKCSIKEILTNNDSMFLVLERSWNFLYNKRRYAYSESEKIILYDKKNSPIEKTKKEIDDDILEIIKLLEKRIESCHDNSGKYILI